MTGVQTCALPISLPVDILIGVGDLMSYTNEEFPGENGEKLSLHVKDPEEAREVLLRIVNKEDTV